MLVCTAVPMTLSADANRFTDVTTTGRWLLGIWALICIGYWIYKDLKPEQIHVAQVTAARDDAKNHAETAEQHKTDAEHAVNALNTLMANLNSPNKALAALVELYVVGDSQGTGFDTVQDPNTVTCVMGGSSPLTTEEQVLLYIAYREAYKVDATLVDTDTIQKVLDVLNR